MRERYLNIQKGPDGRVTVFLYGEIGDYGEVSSGRVAAELKKAETSGAPVDVRINSTGGDVYSGIAIYNAIRNSRADVRVYVDGVAASMAAVIALCGRRVEMSRYARLMIHNVSGGCYGNREDMRRCIEEIEALEESLAVMLGERLGLGADAVKAEYFDGRDHWLTAAEAVERGLVDGLYDVAPVPAGSTPEQIYGIFNNRLMEPHKEKDMIYEELKKRARFANCADDASVLEELGRLEEAAAEADGLRERVSELEAAAEAAAAEERARVLDEAEAEGRIDARSRQTFENILKRDMAEGKAALKAIRPRRSVMEDIRRDGEGEGPWVRRMREIREGVRK